MPKSKRSSRKHGSAKKEEREPPSDTLPPVDYRDDARRVIHSGRPSPRYDEHV